MYDVYEDLSQNVMCDSESKNVEKTLCIPRCPRLIINIFSVPRSAVVDTGNQIILRNYWLLKNGVRIDYKEFRVYIDDFPILQRLVAFDRTSFDNVCISKEDDTAYIQTLGQVNTDCLDNDLSVDRVSACNSCAIVDIVSSSICCSSLFLNVMTRSRMMFFLVMSFCQLMFLN